MLEVVRGRVAIGLITVFLALAGPLTGALAGAVLVPIAGLDGRAVAIAGSLRTSDGGAIVVARVGRSAAARDGQIVVARLESDGALDLAYGTEGLVSLTSGPLAPTALAIDPRTGAAWIGARSGRRGPGEIIALDGAGRAERGFGRRGILRLPARDDGGPLALAWSVGALFVAAGESPCAGCQLGLRVPRSGRPLAAVALPAADVAPSGCHGTSVSGAAFVGSRLALATSVTGGRGCAGTILQLGHSLALLAPAPAAAALPPGRSTTVAGADGSTCAASSAPRGVAIRPLGARPTIRSTLAPAGRLLALVALGPDACAALIAGGRGATVAQMQASERHAVTDRVPRDVTALAMFRCNQHLLVLGTTASSGERSAVILPVPVRRGPFARSAAIAAAPTTGCGG